MLCLPLISRNIYQPILFSYLSTYFFSLETIIEKKAPAAPHQRVTDVPEGETSTEEDVMDDKVKDKGKGRDLENIGEGSGSGNESGDEDELKGEGGLKSQSDGEDIIFSKLFINLRNGCHSSRPSRC